MFHTSSWITTTATIFLLACNNAGQQPDTNKTDSAANSPQPITATAAAVIINDDLLNAVYQKYEELTEALIKDEVAKARIAASALEAGAKEMGNSQLIVNSCLLIMDAKNIEEQRVAYSGLSNALISRVKAAGLSEGRLYIEFCPMAFNDKGGFWLSSSPEIKNPYFGDRMMTCGEVKETLKFP